MNILVVCTGNICRSPLAEHLLQASLPSATVTSAGTRALVGRAMTPEAAILALEYGAAPAVHSARQLTPDLIANADLVLTATREHRAEVVSMFPKSTRYAFTLTQFARLATATNTLVEPVETKDFIANIAASRGLTPPPPHPSDDDIIDPYRQSPEVYAAVAATINTAVTTITQSIGRS